MFLPRRDALEISRAGPWLYAAMATAERKMAVYMDAGYERTGKLSANKTVVGSRHRGAGSAVGRRGSLWLKLARIHHPPLSSLTSDPPRHPMHLRKAENMPLDHHWMAIVPHPPRPMTAGCRPSSLSTVSSLIPCPAAVTPSRLLSILPIARLPLTQTRLRQLLGLGE
jgi:hypothetical protein